MAASTCSTRPAAGSSPAGELTALVGGYLALIQLVLMSRSPWLEQVVGQDALTAAHRWVGFTCVWFIVAHVVLTTIGFALADGSNVIVELWTLLTTYEFMLMAGVSLVLFVGVAISSVKLARRHLSYETWHGIHFYAYLAIALGLGHQLVTGSDFAHDPIAWTYWVGAVRDRGGRRSWSSGSCSPWRRRSATSSGWSTSNGRAPASSRSTSAAATSIGLRSGPASS